MRSKHEILGSHHQDFTSHVTGGFRGSITVGLFSKEHTLPDLCPWQTSILSSIPTLAGVVGMLKFSTLQVNLKMLRFDDNHEKARKMSQHTI